MDKGTFYIQPLGSLMLEAMVRKWIELTCDRGYLDEDAGDIMENIFGASWLRCSEKVTAMAQGGGNEV